MRVLNIYRGVQDKGMHSGTPTIFVDVVGSKTLIKPNPVEDDKIDKLEDLDLSVYRTNFPYHLCAQTTFHLTERMTHNDVAAAVIELLPDAINDDSSGWLKNMNEIHLCFNMLDSISEDDMLNAIKCIRRHCNLNKINTLKTVVFNINGNVFPSREFLQTLNKLNGAMQLERSFTALFQVVTHDTVDVKYDLEAFKSFIYSVVECDHRIAFLNETVHTASFTQTLKWRTEILKLIPRDGDEVQMDSFLRDRLAYVLRVAKFYVFSNENPDRDLIEKCFEYGFNYHPAPLNSFGKYAQPLGMYVKR